MACICPGNLPSDYSANCGDELYRPGGISHLVFIDCSSTLTDYTDVSELETLETGGDLVVTKAGLGSKDAASITTTKLYSCLPEVITGKEHTINFSTYVVDTATQADFDFFQELEENHQGMQVVYFGCDGLVYGADTMSDSGGKPGFDFSLQQLDYVQPEDGVNEKAHYQLTLTINKRGILKGWDIPGLIAALTD